MHSTCILHVHSLHALYRHSHAFSTCILYMHSPHVPHALTTRIQSTCLLHALSMYCACTLHELYMHSACTLHVLHMHSPCAVNECSITSKIIVAKCRRLYNSLCDHSTRNPERCFMQPICHSSTSLPCSDSYGVSPRSLRRHTVLRDWGDLQIY